VIVEVIFIDVVEGRENIRGLKNFTTIAEMCRPIRFYGSRAIKIPPQLIIKGSPCRPPQQLIDTNKTLRLKYGDEP
jgi:hypothetical protein